MITLDQSGAVIANGSDLTFPGAHSPARGRIADKVARRAPGYRDDERCGFRAGDLWQADRTLYTCLKSSAEGAIWDLARDGAGACPGDVFGTDLAGAWGVDAMIGGYTGPAFDVTTIAGGARQVTTISILPGGRHDADALARVLVMRDTGSPAEVTTLYDQSGRNHPLTGTYGNAPRIGAVTVNGHAAISFDASGARQRRALANAEISVPSSSFTALAFGKWTATNSALNENIQLLTVGTFSTISGIDEDGRLGVHDGKTFFRGASRQKCNPGMAGISAAGGVVSVWSGEQSDPIAVYPSALEGNATGFTLGASGVGQSCNGVLTGVVLARRAATETDFSRAYRSGALRWDWTPQARPRLWAIGDSRTAGYLSENGLTWPTMISDYLDQPMTVINLGVSGSKTEDFISMTLPGVQDDLARDPDAYNLAVIWLGINDFAGGRNKDVTMQNIRKIVAALLEGGVQHVWVISEIFAGDQEWFWQYLPCGENPDLTLVGPFTAGMPLSPFGKTGVDTIVWHPDGIHPLPSAGRVIASTLADSINAFIVRDLER
ncbi:SGNH/GDSL hydrolase family protein [Asaia prunellae]|uniref:SGNH/GDSL hydrolase family protein n=1 Tax=Asaia prunellae TaxID=610245 RepID=UPI000470D58B|nr:SGNH/GDSL hydrolase family protein [Asaia prunellae]